MESPLIETIDVSRYGVDDAASRIHRHWHQKAHFFWLDSGCNAMRLGQFSFLGIDPYGTLTADGDVVRSTLFGECEQWNGDPWEALADAAEPVFSMARPIDDVPFLGGLVGYLAYDLGQHTVPGIRLQAKRDVSMPDLAFGFYDAVVCIDHRDERLILVSTGLPQTGRHRGKRAAARMRWLRSEVDQALSRPSAPTPHLGSTVTWRNEGAGPVSEMNSTFSRDEYMEAARSVLREIERGHLEQVNLAQRFSLTTSLTATHLYERLRRASPAPFGALLRLNDVWIMSTSPERFLLMRDDHIEMRPIKGTRPRGNDVASDAENRYALLVSEKDKSEHMMIVEDEIARLEEICLPNTVTVPELRVCEEYQTVFHLVSTVVGKLPSATDRVGAVRRLFPPGSITGRPKARSIETIDALEPVRRGIYTGAIGYLGIGGNVDLSVAIRTLVLSGEQAHFHVGGAIVAASVPDDEYEETLDKAEGIVRALLEPSQ